MGKKKLTFEHVSPKALINNKSKRILLLKYL